MAVAVLLNFSGCRLFKFRDAPVAAPSPAPNPLPVPLLDRTLVMDEISDEIDDYLPILKEERIRLVDGIMSEGWIETRPKIGGSIFEPWKKDSTPGFERRLATLQTIRRFAKVRIIPTADSYLIDLRVYKELEDLSQPLGSSISSRPTRVDDTLDIDRIEIPVVENAGWIPLGRDFSLEQTILQNIRKRFEEALQQQNGCDNGDCRYPG